jgi:hypothetical protein
MAERDSKLEDMDRFLRNIIMGTLEKHGLRTSSTAIDYDYTPGEDATGVFLDVRVVVNIHGVPYDCGIWRIREGAISDFASSERELPEFGSLDWAVSLSDHIRDVIRIDDAITGDLKDILSMLQPFISQMSSLECLLSENNVLAISISSIFEASKWHDDIGKVTFKPNSLKVFNARKNELLDKVNGRWFWRESETLSKTCRAFPASDGRDFVQEEDVNCAFDFYEAIMYELYGLDKLRISKTRGPRELIRLDSLSKPSALNSEKVKRIFEHWNYLEIEGNIQNLPEVIIEAIIRFSLLLYAFSQYSKFRKNASLGEVADRIRSAFGVKLDE